MLYCAIYRTYRLSLYASSDLLMRAGSSPKGDERARYERLYATCNIQRVGRYHLRTIGEVIDINLLIVEGPEWCWAQQ